MELFLFPPRKSGQNRLSSGNSLTRKRLRIRRDLPNSMHPAGWIPIGLPPSSNRCARIEAGLDIDNDHAAASKQPSFFSPFQLHSSLDPFHSYHRLIILPAMRALRRPHPRSGVPLWSSKRFSVVLHPFSTSVLSHQQAQDSALGSRKGISGTGSLALSL